jgi:threonine aldolase
MSITFPIDLRSDTVTRPTPAMRKAMADAEVGDDVFGEDPSVNRLQDRVAEILGTEAALFVPTGTMGNQICLAAQSRPGDEIILDENAHILNYEGGGPAFLSGLLVRALKGAHGLLTADQIADVIHPPGNAHVAPTTIISVENTHNRSGGTIYELSELKRIRELAAKHDIRVHMDGARVWNATIASGLKESDFAAQADSISVCFSKGLGAPVGSAAAGTKDMLRRAHRYRKIFGGGMRQAGVLAAAALYALENHRERLVEDHQKAAILARELTQHPKLVIEAPVQSNILIIKLHNTEQRGAQLAEKCGQDGVLFFATGKQTFRLVTHLDVPVQAMKTAADIILRNVE